MENKKSIDKKITMKGITSNISLLIKSNYNILEIDYNSKPGLIKQGFGSCIASEVTTIPKTRGKYFLDVSNPPIDGIFLLKDKQEVWHYSVHKDIPYWTMDGGSWINLLQ